MNLKEFVKETLVEVAGAVSEANKELNGTGRR